MKTLETTETNGELTLMDDQDYQLEEDPEEFVTTLPMPWCYPQSFKLTCLPVSKPEFSRKIKKPKKLKFKYPKK